MHCFGGIIRIYHITAVIVHFCTSTVLNKRYFVYRAICFCIDRINAFSGRGSVVIRLQPSLIIIITEIRVPDV